MSPCSCCQQPCWLRLASVRHVSVQRAADYTFPREKQHEELTLAEAEYRQLLGRLLSHGTTTALYFGSLHLSACETLVDVAEEVSVPREQLGASGSC